MPDAASACPAIHRFTLKTGATARLFLDCGVTGPIVLHLSFLCLSITICILGQRHLSCLMGGGMVKLMRQLDWLRVSQTVGKTLFLGMSVKIFEEEISIRIGRVSNEDSLVNVSGHLPIHSRSKKNKKTGEGQICFLCLLRHPSLLPSDAGAPGRQIELHHQLF